MIKFCASKAYGRSMISSDSNLLNDATRINVIEPNRQLRFKYTKSVSEKNSIRVYLNLIEKHVTSYCITTIKLLNLKLNGRIPSFENGRRQALCSKETARKS